MNGLTTVVLTPGVTPVVVTPVVVTSHNEFDGILRFLSTKLIHTYTSDQSTDPWLVAFWRNVFSHLFSDYTGRSMTLSMFLHKIDIRSQCRLFGEALPPPQTYKVIPDDWGEQDIRNLNTIWKDDKSKAPKYLIQGGRLQPVYFQECTKCESKSRCSYFFPSSSSDRGGTIDVAGKIIYCPDNSDRKVDWWFCCCGQYHLCGACYILDKAMPTPLTLDGYIKGYIKDSSIRKKTNANKKIMVICGGCGSDNNSCVDHAEEKYVQLYESFAMDRRYFGILCDGCR